MATTSSILPEWLAPRKEAQVEFGGAGGSKKGLLLKALVLEIDLSSNIVHVSISSTDPQAKQYHLNGQEMFVEIHRLHPADESKRLKPVNKPESSFLGLPDRNPMFYGFRQISASITRQASATRESSEEYDPSDREGSASLMSWNSVSTSFYSLFTGFNPSQEMIPTPTNRIPPKPRQPSSTLALPNKRRPSISESITLVAQEGLEQLSNAPQAVMRAWSSWSQNDVDEIAEVDEEITDGYLSDGIDYFDDGEDYLTETTEDEGDEDELNSVSNEKVGYVVGEKVMVLLGDAWYDGVVLERYANGNNYLVRMYGSPRHLPPVRQFWASHVRKVDE